jgi:hypothetical protein
VTDTPLPGGSTFIQWLQDYFNALQFQQLKQSNPKNVKLTEAQCQAARILLDREKKYGTTVTAWKSAIGYGDSTIEPFNSTNTAPIDSTVGPIKLDWYTDLQLAGPIPATGNLYPVAKLTWTGVRLANGQPITNAFPFTDAAETNAYNQSMNPFSTYSDIFTPKLMAEACGESGGGW